MRMNKINSESGAVNPLVLSNVVVGVIAVALAGFAVWSFVNYMDQKNNVDSKVNTAVAEAKKVQSDDDQKRFVEQEKLPTREFVGPEDLGRVSFQYPKTWSIYIASDGSKGKYEAYMNPISVPTVSDSQPYAVRVTVESSSYESVLKTYEARVTKKDLSSNPVTIGSFTGIRLDGTFSKTRKGSAVIFKVRDKTLTIASDAETFKSDFDNTVLTSLSFNP